jgi:hypothetical protein
VGHFLAEIAGAHHHVKAKQLKILVLQLAARSIVGVTGRRRFGKIAHAIRIQSSQDLHQRFLMEARLGGFALHPASPLGVETL